MQVFRNVISKCRSMFRSSDQADTSDAHLSYYHDQRDPEHNATSTPPSQENIRTPCFWAVEYYPPSYYGNLLDGLRTLGWDNPADPLAGDSPAEWLKDLRRQPYGGAAFNLGFVQRESDERASLGRVYNVKDDLFPEGIHDMYPWIYLPVASHTALAVQFFLNDDYASRIHDILSREYQTYAEPISSGRRYHTVPNQIKEEIHAFRDRVRSEVINWYHTHVPGILSDKSRPGSVPTIEFTLLDWEEPFEGDQSPDQAYYLRLMQMDSPFTAWEAVNVPGLKLGGTTTREWQAPHLVAAAKRSRLFADDDMEGYGGRTDRAFSSRLDQLRKWVVYWGLSHLMRGYEATMSNIRDRVLQASGRSIEEADDLAILARNLTAFERDCIPFLNELPKDYDSEGAFSRFNYEFRRMGPSLARTDAPLLETIRKNLIQRSDGLSSLLGGLGESIRGWASLASTRESTTLQRRVLWLTVVVALSAGVALGQAIFGRDFLGKALSSLVTLVQ